MKHILHNKYDHNLTAIIVLLSCSLDVDPCVGTSSFFVTEKPSSTGIARKLNIFFCGRCHFNTRAYFHMVPNEF
jgi:hypothetical protein